MNAENATAGIEALDALMQNQQKVLLRLIEECKTLKHENVSLKKRIIVLEGVLTTRNKEEKK